MRGCDTVCIIASDAFCINREIMTISAAQIRAARGLLNWSQSALAEAANLSRPTIDRAERANVSLQAVAAIQSALEAAGVQFIPEDGGGQGVRLKKEDR